MPQPPSALRALARRAGVLDSYVEQGGRAVRHTSDETREALLQAMGLAAGDEAEARRALEAWEARDAESLMPAVRVARGAQDARQVLVRVPGGHRGPIGWQIAQQIPAGGDTERTGRSVPDAEGRLSLSLPVDPEPGYHRIRVRLHFGTSHPVADQRLIVAPLACPDACSRLGGKAFGVAANLYAVRSERNWGAGDLTDLTMLMRWVASRGGSFVGVNPLHALRNTRGDISPYRPVSRIYRNPLYIDVEAVPEFADSADARRIMDAPEARAELHALRRARWLDYDAVWRLKSRALDALYATFRERHRGSNSSRGRAFDEYVIREGSELEDHATFMALEEAQRAEGNEGSWHSWPAELRDARSPAVAEFREREAARVDRFRWLQFETERQVSEAGSAAREMGMPIGLYQDLAIGCSPDGSDAWANQNLLLSDISLGAPPDQYSDSGQNWGLPPINPHVLQEQRFEYWIHLVRSALEHGGALRIDHILGLFRQFWIPAGMAAAQGAYVRFPTADLLGILALEATMAGAIIVGEDLGTVPPEVGPTLRDWGILGTKVMYFERVDGPGFRPARDYEELALTVADTHDQVPVAGFWAGRDVEIREEAGLLTAEGAAQARQDREVEREKLAERLQLDGGLDARSPDAHSIVCATHRYLCATPSLMVSLSLEDVAGETEPVNVPGVDHDAYPSWTRRLTTPLEALVTDPAAQERLAACEDRRRA